MTTGPEIVLITGAASGIGLELSRLYVAGGSQVVGLDRDVVGLSAARNELGEAFHPLACDLTDSGAIGRAAAVVLQKYGSVDILINNAGIVVGKNLVSHTEADIDRTFAINALAPMRLTKALLPSMLERNKGHIVTVASAGGLVAAPRMTAYAASKFAAVGFDEALRLELRKSRSKVRTTVVCPFFVGTGMFEGAHTRVPWLLPMLDQKEVARRTVRAVARGRHRLIMPWFVYAVYPVRLLPVSWFDRVLDLFGITSTMDHFTGRDPGT